MRPFSWYNNIVEKIPLGSTGRNLFPRVAELIFILHEISLVQSLYIIAEELPRITHYEK